MMRACLTSARFNMTALIVVPGTTPSNTDDVQEPDIEPTEPGVQRQGRYEYQQDPDSGAIVKVWVPEPDTDPDEPGIQPAEPTTPGSSPVGRRIPVMARGFIDGGIRVTGTTERFSPRGTYENVDYVTLKFPADVVLTKRDRVTDIRNNRGVLLWKEEEFDDSATVFEVMGVTPVVDPFGNHIENSALLQRAEVQD